MARAQKHYPIARSSDRSTLELVCFGVLALAAVLLIAASSLSFETQPIQPMADGEVVPVHIVGADAG